MTTLAQNLFNLMARDEIGPDTLALLKHMMQSGSVELTDPVKVERSEMTLERAMRSLIEPGKYTPTFYRPATAQRLLEVDPWFFCQGVSGPCTALWLGELLSAWSRHENRDRFGFSPHYIPTIDEWACVAVQSLPDSHRTNDALWKASLKLGLEKTACLLAPYRPDGWLGVDEKGKPDLASANGAWAWERALESGVDPYAQVGPRQKPLWRAMLPNASTSAADPGSVRAGVESWVREQTQKPGHSPMLMEYMQRLCTGRMSVNMGKSAWMRAPLSEKLAFVQTLPDTWVNWTQSGAPAWLALTSAKDFKVKEFAGEMHKRAQWVKQIHSDPLSHLALNVLGMAFKDLDPSDIRADTAAALEDPRYPRTLDLLAKLLKKPVDPLDAFIQSAGLAANTPQAASSRPRPRM